MQYGTPALLNAIVPHLPLSDTSDILNSTVTCLRVTMYECAAKTKFLEEQLEIDRQYNKD